MTTHCPQAATSNPLRLVRMRPKTYVCLLDVLWVEGAGPYSIIQLKDAHHIKVSIPLYQMARRLPELIRCSKRSLVNLAHVEVVPRHSNLLRLKTGQTLPVARRRKAETRRLLQVYQIHQVTQFSSL